MSKLLTPSNWYYGTLSPKACTDLADTVQKLMTPGKGILAADEKTSTIGSRFKPVNIENNAENRAAYRELLFTSDELEKYISGIILYEETLFGASNSGNYFNKMIEDKGIVIGIKVDEGLIGIPQNGEEQYTLGLDTLDTRCKKYYGSGARFAKWRAVLSIDKLKGKPTNTSVQESAMTLAKYAATCQINGLVPIIEPEILQDGDFTLKECADTTRAVCAEVIHACQLYGVYMPGALLKPNMVLPGAAVKERPSPADVGLATLRVFEAVLPSSFGGIVLLSGGQSEEEATIHLNAINVLRNQELEKYGRIRTSFRYTFSYGRALQKSCIATWLGKSENLKKAQAVLIDRCKANSEATLGTYSGWAGNAAEAQANQHVNNYSY